jgi:hypothetical protein
LDGALWFVQVSHFIYGWDWDDNKSIAGESVLQVPTKESHHFSTHNYAYAYAPSSVDFVIA